LRGRARGLPCVTDVLSHRLQSTDVAGVEVHHDVVAVNKAVNERLDVQYNYLQRQVDEVCQLKVVVVQRLFAHCSHV